MFLSTLREIIHSKPECLGPYIQTLSPLFQEQAGNDEEYIRNIVAESLGKMYVAHANELTPILINSIE